MRYQPDPSVTNLQQSMALYRKLLSLIKTPKSEDEVIRFVIDSLYELFPEYRVAFSNVGADGDIFIVYAREPESMVSVTGKTFNISRAPQLLQALLARQPLVVNDVRQFPLLAPVVEGLLGFGPSRARFDMPFSEANGKVSMLSVTRAEAGDWDRYLVELFTEVGELLSLIFRESRAQNKLQNTEIVFRQFAENVNVVFWMTDIHKNEMLYVSPSYEKVWGRSTQSIYDDPLSFLDGIHPDDRVVVAPAITRQPEEPYEQTFRVLKPNGEVRWVKDRGFPVRDESGRVHRIAGIAEDITQLREAQERLEATQAQVVSNTKFAALGEMASGIAHEINNPLAVIHGLAVQLQERLRDDPTTKPFLLESLLSMEKMSTRIAGIVKGLRTFSRQTAGDPMQAADLNSILLETMVMCEARLRAANIDLKISNPSHRLGIRCRSSEISQVILNLVNNAYDAVASTPQRTIGITAENKLGYTRLLVEDNGTGIRPDLRDRIFLPFFTTKEVGRGTGLGLSISKGIVETHGGKLFLDTEAKNTRFVVELPSEPL